MSCCGAKKDFCLGLGETFSNVVRWGSSVLASKAITAITQAAPTTITAVAHGVPDGWSVAVISAGGVTEINSANYPPRSKDWHRATLLTVDTVQLNDVSTADWSAYTSGGFLVYATPVDMTGMTGVMVVYDSPDESTVLLTSELGGAITLAIDNTLKTITMTFETESLTWTTGYYTLEMTDSLGKVTQLLTGVITLQ